MLMETFRQMVNNCIRIGLRYNVSSMKHLCNLTYKQLDSYRVLTYYKLCASSHAAGILANRKKSLKRGLNPREPYAKRAFLVSCYGFKIVDGVLKVPLGDRRYFHIPLNDYLRKTLSDRALHIHSFTLTADAISVCYSKEVAIIECIDVSGIDRNLRNITVGSSKEMIHYDLSKTIDIIENTRSIIRSFKRNDARIGRKLCRKYGKRRKQRVSQLLHMVTKAIVQRARQKKVAIAFEDIRHIRSLYQRGNNQGRAYRGQLNSWSFAEVKRQIEYKATWEGVPVIQLTKGETRCTSQLCPRCGEKITQVDRRMRQLWCHQCKKWMDRDIAAAMNLSMKGLQRFCSSKGLAGESMKGNLERDPVILRVDASKLVYRAKR